VLRGSLGFMRATKSRNIFQLQMEYSIKEAMKVYDDTIDCTFLWHS